MKRDRFFILNCGQNIDPIKTAIDYASKIQSKEIFLIIKDDSFRRNLQDIGLIKESTNESIVANNKVFKIIPFNKFIKTPIINNSVIITLWLAVSDLFIIDEIAGLNSIIAIPWTDKSLEKWTLTYGPIDIKSNKRMEYKNISSPVLLKEFEMLTKDRINWSILHPQDIRTIKQLIITFQSEADPLEIFAYLMREKNLNFNSSQKLMEWTNDLLNGKKVRV